MSEIRILNLCLKKTILVDIYRQSLLSIKCFKVDDNIDFQSFIVNFNMLRPIN